MLVLDTDTITLLQRDTSPEATTLKRRLAASGEPVTATIISFEEQVRGWMAYLARQPLPRQPIAYARLRELLEYFAANLVADFSMAAADEFARLRAVPVRIGSMDLKIAAIALSQDATVVSRNLRDFQKVPGLRVVDLTRP